MVRISCDRNDIRFVLSQVSSSNGNHIGQIVYLD